LPPSITDPQNDAPGEKMISQETHNDIGSNSEPAAPSDPIAQTLSALEARASVVDEQVRRFVVDRPFTSLAIAIAGGFVIGKLLSR